MQSTEFGLFINLTTAKTRSRNLANAARAFRTDSPQSGSVLAPQFRPLAVQERPIRSPRRCIPSGIGRAVHGSKGTIPASDARKTAFRPPGTRGAVGEELVLLNGRPDEARHGHAFSWHSQVSPPRLGSPQTADTRRAVHFALDPARLAAWQASRCTRRPAHPKSRWRSPHRVRACRPRLHP